MEVCGQTFPIFFLPPFVRIGASNSCSSSVVCSWSYPSLAGCCSRSGLDDLDCLSTDSESIASTKLQEIEDNVAGLCACAGWVVGSGTCAVVKSCQRLLRVGWCLSLGCVCLVDECMKVDRDYQDNILIIKHRFSTHLDIYLHSCLSGTLFDRSKKPKGAGGPKDMWLSPGAFDWVEGPQST
jgi:hypothetical protein